jgi:hypothetical protein
MPDPWCSFGTRIASRIWGTLVYPRNCWLLNWRRRYIPLQTEVTNRWPDGRVACSLLTLVGGAVKVGSVAPGAGRYCAPAALVGRFWAAAQLRR